ncbi:unnamed protein product [Staurois parvus]|uniref:Uncharacterized protein n=1 Tax=Staurois parvus TaxID=386267 RepID=A0ABN9FUY0_9NEOB|nr:unnamed protein product [Staurois parvus]
MSLFVIFKFPAVPSPVRPDARRGRNPDDKIPASAGGHYRGHCRRDIAGAQDKVREEQIPEQRRMVFPSVARGYHLWY